MIEFGYLRQTGQMYGDAHAANEAYGCVLESVGKEGHKKKQRENYTNLP